LGSRFFCIYSFIHSVRPFS